MLYYIRRSHLDHDHIDYLIASESNWTWLANPEKAGRFSAEQCSSILPKLLNSHIGYPGAYFAIVPAPNRSVNDPDRQEQMRNLLAEFFKKTKKAYEEGLVELDKILRGNA